MNCTKCGCELDLELKCGHCGAQYHLIDRTGTAEFTNYPYGYLPMYPPPANTDFYYPEDEYIQWEWDCDIYNGIR